ncbi:MAG: isoprenyl transferase [Candidatus Marinimicrobia bacterium]|nr:isoprenyl transferase [Candidatus Neomarinimicrobiota bacterium]MDP6789114.1 isoprenyl transferase [Candidatus Neomarinimicrobiota bacterium]MDP7072016.1 isoprenyl transferase [Candidatus Neomarinimicrobiota bacterium]
MTSSNIESMDISSDRLPGHIAIIMDGNGRWAKQRGLPRITGHSEGINSVREITRVCGEIGIKHLTLYTFSQENWSRPAAEVSALMKLLLKTIRKEVENLHEKNVRLTAIGSVSDLPDDARRGIEDGIALTRDNSGLNLNLALSYGGRQELMIAMKKIGERMKNGNIDSEEIDEDLVSSMLQTSEIPDPDLLIRTGGEYRISNFLLWQIAYTELFVSSKYWPEFREDDLLEAINIYQDRERRYGKVSEQVA